MTTSRARGWLLLTMCAGMFLVQLDVTVVNVALPAIGNDLNATLPDLQWIVDGYAVVLASMLLCGGAAGDVLGHRPVVVSGFGLFGLASIGCGLAGSGAALVGFRALQGLGAALLLPGTLAVITGSYPRRREQAKALGVWAGVSALALAAGPLLGGVLVTAAGWRSLFWINVPLAAAAIIATHRLAPSQRPTKARRVDVAGAFTAAVALAAAVLAVISAGGSGVSVTTLFAGAVAVGAGVAFALVERRVADPMLPSALLRSRPFVGANLVAGAMNFVGLGLILIVTLYLQRVLGASPLRAAVWVLPLFVPLSVLAPLSGRLVARYGPRPLMITGLALGVFGTMNLVRVTEGSGYPTLLPTMIATGVGLGLLTPAVVAAAVAGAPTERAGVASGVNNTARQAAGALGVAAFGAIAGEPGRHAEFVSGLHLVGLVAAAVWLAAIAVTASSVR